MITKVTEKLINDAAVTEYQNAITVYGPSYNSLHEGYAVLKEEVEEVETDFNYIKDHLSDLWQSVKHDDAEDVRAEARLIAKYALYLAEEACQVAAVAKKICKGGNK